MEQYVRKLYEVERYHRKLDNARILAHFRIPALT